MRERIDHWKEPAVDGGPFAGVPRWLYVAMLGAACVAFYATQLL
jgi:hypothetical protein